MDGGNFFIKQMHRGRTGDTLRQRRRLCSESWHRHHPSASGGLLNSKEEQPYQLKDKNRMALKTLLSFLLLNSLPLMAEAPLLPSEVIDLSRWKLQLPEGVAQPDHPDEVKQPELKNFSHPSFFFVNEEEDALIFRAHCGGATTVNSDYPRSELREMTADGKLASWQTSSKDPHILKARLAIMQTPKVKPHLVCAQIHDTHDDLLVIRLEKNHLFIRRDKLPKITLDSDYQLGTPFSFEIHSGHGNVLVFYEGKKVLTWEIQADTCYYKSGCYIQSNPERGDSPEALGEVHIFKLSLSSKKP